MAVQAGPENGNEALTNGIKIDQADPKNTREKLPKAAEVRGEWKDFIAKEGLNDPAKINAAKEERRKKVEELKKTNGEPQKEAWISNKAAPGLLAEAAKASIEGKLDSALQDKLKSIQELGLSQAAIQTFKTAIVDHIYDFYVKNDNSSTSTKNYVDTILIPKATFLFESLTKIYKSGSYPFTSTFDCLQKFSDFSGLNFTQEDNFSLAGLQNLMEADQNTYNRLITNFSNALQPMQEMEQLDNALKSLGGKESKQNGSEKSQKDSAQNKPLPSAERPITTETGKTTPAEAPKSSEKTNLEPEQPNQPNPAQNTPSTPAATPSSSPGSTPATPKKTPPIAPKKADDDEVFPIFGIKELDKLLNKYLKPFFPILIKMGLIPETKVAPKNLLSAKELEEAKQFEKILTEEPYRFPQEVLKKLFEDPKQLKTVLDAKNQKKLDWPAYLAQHIDASENQELKNNSSLKKEEIVAKFLSENQKPAATDSTFQGPA